jgi:hypothetical protein
MIMGKNSQARSKAYFQLSNDALTDIQVLIAVTLLMNMGMR